MAESVPILKSMKVAILANIVFFLFNIAVGLGNYFIPKYIERPKLAIKYAKATPTSRPISVPKDLYTELGASKLGAISPSALGQDCIIQYSRNTFSPGCLKEFHRVIDNKIDILSDIHKQVEKDISDLVLARNDKEFKIPVENPSIMDLQQFGLMVRHFVRPEMREDAWRMIVNSRQIEMKGYLEDNLKETNILKRVKDSIKYEDNFYNNIDGGLVVEVGVLNSGGQDTLVYPRSTMKITGAEIVLKQRMDANGTVKLESESFLVAKANGFRRLIFTPDKDQTLPKNLDVLSSHLKNRNSAEFSLEISDGDQNYKMNGHISLSTMWLDDLLQYRNPD